MAPSKKFDSRRTLFLITIWIGLKFETSSSDLITLTHHMSLRHRTIIWYHIIHWIGDQREEMPYWYFLMLQRRLQINHSLSWYYLNRKLFRIRCTNLGKCLWKFNIWIVGRMFLWLLDKKWRFKCAVNMICVFIQMCNSFLKEQKF